MRPLQGFLAFCWALLFQILLSTTKTKETYKSIVIWSWINSLVTTLLIKLIAQVTKNIRCNKQAVARRCSVKKDVTKNFTQFTGKHLCRSLSEACNFIKKSLQHRCFHVHFAKFLTHLFYRTPPREFFWKDNFHGNFYVALEKVVWKLILTSLQLI